MSSISKPGRYENEALLDCNSDVLPPLTEAEREKILVQWNTTAKPYPAQMCLHQLFEAQVDQAPDSIAISYEDACLTYTDLNSRANQLAYYLRHNGVGPEVVVGICMERSIELIIGMLGILKAGGAYVPLDPSYPKNRLSLMLSEVQPSILLTQQRLSETLPPNVAHVLFLDSQQELFSALSPTNLHQETAPEHLAYLIYTSGSTGKPKGVMMPHSAVCNHLAWRQDVTPLTAQDRFLHKASSSFDISVMEIFWPLTTGAQLVLVRTEAQRDSTSLLRIIMQQQITVAHFGPAMLQVFLEEPEVKHCISLKRVFCGGEALRPQLQMRFFEQCKEATLYQQYGPTETCIDVTLWQCEHPGCLDVQPPIGKPIANVCIYLLDDHLQPVPIGSPGEIYIGGACLARGYWQQPELTQERFIPNPFATSDCTRLYRTGDLACYLPDGNIKFLGRLDQQVKIRGFRIEPGEIEATLNKHPAISQSIVLTLPHLGTKEHISLVAYVISTLPEEQVAITLRSFLQDHLPEYMIPVAFVHLKKFPLNVHGKIDRSAFPTPDQRHFAHNDTTPPRNTLEAEIANTWSRLLGLPQIGIYASFFQLGGNSLLATQMTSYFLHLFQKKVPLQYFYEHATVAELAHFFATEEQKPVSSIALSRTLEPEKQVEISFGQQRLWNIEQIHEGTPIYNLPYTISFAGRLHTEALRRSLRTIIDRHAVLRSTWQEHHEKMLLTIDETYSLTLPVIDLSSLTSEERAQQRTNICTQEALQPFDLRHGPLLRATLLHVEYDKWLLLLTFHHGIFDGWSTNVFLQELQQCYLSYIVGQEPLLPALSVQYSDYAVWQREQLAQGLYTEDSNYWATQLQNAPPVLDLSPDYPRPAFPDIKGAIIPVHFDAPFTRRLSQFALDEHCSLFMLLLTTWFCLLHRYTGQDDLLVSTPMANRTTPQIETLLGFFVNTLILRARLQGSLSFRALLKQVKEITLQAYEHQDLPLEHILAQASASALTNQPPQIQTMLVLNPADLALHLPELEVSVQRRQTHTADFEITLELRESAHGLSGVLEYNTALFSAERMQRLVDHFTILLQESMNTPEQPISMLPLLTPTEQFQLLHQWNQTQGVHPDTHCMHELFEKQVAQTPEAIALVFEEQRLSYTQLNQQANKLAHYLRKQGIGPDIPVGLFMERSTILMVALLSILKAGGAYIPIDPSYPAGRIAFIIADTQISILLTLTTHKKSLPKCTASILCLDTMTDIVEHEQSTNPILNVTADNLAYILYTSGSTGQPKGVIIPHRALVNHCQAIATHYQITACDRVLQFASLSFDTAAEEIFPAWSHGATVMMRPRDLADTFAIFLEFIATQRITILDLPTSYWHYLVEAMEDETHATHLPATLRLLIVGGEQASAPHLTQWLRHGNTHVLWSNTYGPTEATITTTIYDHNPDITNLIARETSTRIPIGRPIANARVYILDKYQHPVPVGIPGELYIGGAGLAKGYWRRPELTQERFVINPFDSSKATKLYRTGDLVRYLSDGNIEFLGRIDHQIKIRGYRIELGEIEAVLNEHPAISQCVVIARSDKGSNKQVVAYVISTITDDELVTSLRSYLQERLPAYMVPTAFVGMKQIPFNVQGKVDHTLLPLPARQHFSEREYIPPRNPLEEALVAIWSELLAISEVGIHASFFQLGGNSLLAIQLVSRILRLFQQKLPLQYLFVHPTIAELAQFLTTEEPQASHAHAVARALKKVRTMSLAEKHHYLEIQKKHRGGGTGNAIIR